LLLAKWPADGEQEMVQVATLQQNLFRYAKGSLARVLTGQLNCGLSSSIQRRMSL